MPTPEKMLSAIKQNTSHGNFLTRLITPEVDALSKQIFESLEKRNPVINPGKDKPTCFNDLSSDMKELLAVQTALDILHAAKYKESIQQQVGHETTQKIDEVQALEGPVKHIKEEGTVIYHGVYHPIESAAITAALVQSLMNNKASQGEIDVLKKRAATLFIHHDRVQNLDAANKEEGYKKGKIEGFNEFETAGAVFDERMKLYQNKIDHLSQSGGNPAEIEKLKAMQNEIAYEAWKFIVGGTTMLKSTPPKAAGAWPTPVDGQPTLNTIQALAIDKVLLEDPKIHMTEEQRAALKNNPLVAISLAASAVDSHFPALLTLIKDHPEMGANLPSALMERGVINMSPQLKQLMFATPNDSDSVNRTALFLGQNMRMFSEIHESYNGALAQIQSFSNGREVNGVTVWNEAMHAARMGNNEKVKELLELKIKSFKNSIPPGLNPDMTLMDVFMARIQGEIDFAKNQGPELIARTAAEHGLDASSLNVDAWKKHAEALEKIQQAYKEASPEMKSSMALAFFQIASNQPGLYVDNKQLLANIEKEQVVYSTLSRQKDELSSNVDRLNTQITRLTASLKAAEPSAPASSTAMMGMLFSGAKSKQEQIDALQVRLREEQTKLSAVTKQVDGLKPQQDNLNRVKNDLQQVSNKLQQPEAAQVEESNPHSSL